MPFRKRLFMILLLPLFSSADYTDRDTLVKAQFLLKNSPVNFDARIGYFSEKLLGTRYLFRSFGEGQNGEIQTAPLFHFNSLDCINFIEIVVALSLSKNLTELNDNIKKLRYHNQNVSFRSRNHFSETDWIPNNIQNGILTDITKNLFNESTAALTSTIDRKAWMENLQPALLKPSNLSDQDISKKLKDLSLAETQHVFSLNYISKKYLLKNLDQLAKIPNGAIVHFLATPYLSDTAKYKTQMFVYHAGFVIQSEKATIIRSASAQQAHKKVIDQNFNDYLQEAAKNDNFLGINILQLNKPTIGRL